MKEKVNERVNWPITILLIIGLITVAFPLYMTIVIAFKHLRDLIPSEELEPFELCGGNACDRFLAFPV